MESKVDELSTLKRKKRIKKSGKTLKKGVDREREAWYYYQALCERGPRGRLEGSGENLENDTERRERTTVNSEMSFDLGGLGNQNTRLRIKHKSLILAQDERWRRA